MDKANGKTKNTRVAESIFFCKRIPAIMSVRCNDLNEDIGAEQPAELPDLDQVIFVYCRSGRRSKEASAKLAALGYTNIYEFGGILDWDGEIEK